MLELNDEKLVRLASDGEFRQQFTFMRVLGRGESARVVLADPSGGVESVAIKIFERRDGAEKSSERWAKRLERELSVLRQLDHPNVVQLLSAYSTPSNVFLVMHAIIGSPGRTDLLSFVERGGATSELQARSFFRQILDGIAYCHDQLVVHRDIKPENLLLDSEGSVTIIDFGLATRYEPGVRLNTTCGTPLYASPEIFLSATPGPTPGSEPGPGRSYEGPPVDLWSLGVVLWALTTGTFPFSGTTFQKLRECVLRGVVNPAPLHLSGPLRRLLHSMLTVEPSARPNLASVRAHEWCTKCCKDTPLEFDKDSACSPFVTCKLSPARSLNRAWRLGAPGSAGFFDDDGTLPINNPEQDMLYPPQHCELVHAVSSWEGVLIQSAASSSSPEWRSRLCRLKIPRVLERSWCADGTIDSSFTEKQLACLPFRRVSSDPSFVQDVAPGTSSSVGQVVAKETRLSGYLSNDDSCEEGDVGGGWWGCGGMGSSDEQSEDEE